MEIDLLEARIGHTFEDTSLLVEALTHTTYVNEHKDGGLRDNQRLEFLGDTVINTVITALLFERFPSEKEGPLTKRRAELINEAALSRIAMHLGLGEFLLLGRGEERDGGREKPSLLADAYEALIGAVFLDSSFEKVSAVVRSHYESVFGAVGDVSPSDYKSLLLEYCQAHLKEMPRIVVVRESGPEHSKEFEVVVMIGERVMGRGAGKNKKQASQAACREALRSLGRIR